MRRHLPLALLLLAACFSPTPHVTEESYSWRVSTSDIATGLLEAEDAETFECRIGGEAVEAGEATRRIRELPTGESVRLAMTRGGTVVDMVVTRDSSITAASRSAWTSEARSRWGWK